MSDKFDRSMQEKILLVLLKDRNFIKHYYQFLKPYYFETEVHMDISRIALKYFDKYKNSISYPILKLELKKFLLDNPKRDREEYKNFLGKIPKARLQEESYVKDNIVSFIKCQEYKRAFDKGIEALQSGDYDTIRKVFDKAKQVGDIQGNGSFYFDPQEIRSRMNDTKEEKKIIGTGFPEIDKFLGGGLAPGELGLILAPTNVGKSKTLMQLGANNLRFGKKVVYFTFEMGKDKIMNRFDRNIVGSNRQYLKENRQRAAKIIRKLHTKMNANLFVKEYPTKSATVFDLKRDLDFLGASDFYPDLILIDYPKIMKHTRKCDRGDQEIEETVELLRGMGGEYDAAVWAAAQTNKKAIGSANVTLDQFSDCFAQSHVADVVLALCQTKEEYLKNILRISMLKDRDGLKHQTWNYQTADDIMRIKFMGQHMSLEESVAKARG